MASTKRKSAPSAEKDRTGKKQKFSEPTKNAPVLRQEEPAFPRGGASVLTPLEQKQIQIQAKNDVLFEQSTGKKAPQNEYENDENDSDLLNQHDHTPVKAKRKPRTKGKPSHAAQVPGEKSVRIEGLSYKRLVPGSLVLGQICQINQYDLALSLPNNLTGYVPITSISDQLSKDVEKLAEQEEEDAQTDIDYRNMDVDLNSYFSVGQYLRASVVTTEKDTATGTKAKRHIELSINPRQANLGLQPSNIVADTMIQASVRSVEDHGLIMELGFDGDAVRGFMSSRELGANVEFSKVREGAVYLCLVTGLSSNGNVVKLSADTLKAGNLKKGHFLTNAPNIDCFLPGTAVECLVSEVTSSGILGKAMGILDLTADLIHSGTTAVGKGLESNYAAGEKVKARIICSFPDAEPRKLGISLLEHVVSFHSRPSSPKSESKNIAPTAALQLSTIVPEAKVVKVEPGLGLFLDVGVKDIRGYAHISRIADGKIKTLTQDTGPYKVGSTHKARVIGYNYMDGLYIVSMEPKIIAQPFLSLDDVHVGQIVRGTIQKFLMNENGISGIIITIAEGITGLVPETHFSDIHLQHPERKFKEGASITARVLSKIPAKKQLRLTLKKALVNSDDPIWNSYDILHPTDEAPGTIINITSPGAVVQFYGPVRGFLPVSQMSESYIDDPKKHFRVGQVVRVRILSVDIAEKRMVISCKTLSVSDTAQQEHLQTLTIGSFVTGTVSEKTNEEIILELEGSGLKAILPFEHLSDGSAQKSSAAAKRIRVGQDMKELIVLNKSEGKRLVQISSKPSLLNAAREGKLVKSFEDIYQGAEVDGYVNNVTPIGIFVHFAGGTSGLLLKTQLPDSASSLPDFGMRRNQSISARVLSVDHAQHRFLLTMKPMDSIKVADAGDKVAPSNPAEGLLADPVDEVSTNIDDFSVGKLTKARINSIKETQLNVQLANGVQGRIDVSEVFDDLADIKDRKNPLKSFRPKQVLAVRVLGIHDSRNHRFLPISHRGKAPVFELTAKPMDLKAADLEIPTVEKVQLGSVHVAFVNNITADSIWVNLSPNVRGRIKALDLSDDISVLKDLTKNFPIGSALKAKVINVDVANNRLDLSARSASSQKPLTFSELSTGVVLPGRVTKVSERQVMVQLNETLSGSVNLVDLADDYSEADPTAYEKNQIIRVCVTHVDAPNKRLSLSTRPSKVLSSSLPVKDREITSPSDLAVNDVLQGFVKNVADSGIFITLGNSVTAFVRVSDLSDLYVKDWKAQFEIDQLVKGKVIEVDTALNHVQMSLKKSHIDSNYKPPLTFNDMTVGQVVAGKIRKVEDFGVFIVVDNSANVSGLCHRTQMADGKAPDPPKLYDEGDIVKAKVLKVDREKKRISFGLKASFFTSGDDSDTDEKPRGRSTSEDREVREIEETLAADAEEQASDWEGIDEPQGDESDTHMDDADDDGGGADINGESTETLPQPGLSAGGFDWAGGLPSTKHQSPQPESDTQATAPKKQKVRKERESDIQIDRTGDLDAHGPQSAADYERLLLGQPNASVLWLGYMAFQLERSEIDRARDLAERALATIHIREQEEKRNVWVALLNLENAYGDDDEASVDAVFKRACQHCDSLDMHERLISIYIQSGRHEKADALFIAALSKHGSASPSLWINAATFHLTTLSNPSRAHALLPRALQSLPPHTHLDLTRSFALLEYSSSHGDPERGRTLFENLLATFPRKLDLWTVYVDAEVKKEGDKERIRELFLRVSRLGKWKTKQMRFWFKKWLAWEEGHGDPGGKERVERLAAEWVRRKAEEQGKME